MNRDNFPTTVDSRQRTEDRGQPAGPDRKRLEELLRERGIDDAPDFLAAFPDDEIAGAFNTVALFDSYSQPKGKGLLVMMLRERRGSDFHPLDDSESAEERKARVRRERHEKDVRWAERNGFTKAQTPFAASAKRVIAMLGDEPSAESVRARVKAQHPHLFDGVGAR